MMESKGGQMKVNVTARNAITAATFLGDEETMRYAPTGLSNSSNLEALIAAAQVRGCQFDA
jgi:hypothetical protein